MEKLTIDKLMVLVAILIASIVLGGFYYASQVSKQSSIERQQQVKIEEERKVKEGQTQKEEAQKALMYSLLEGCLAGAKSDYLSYAKINGTENTKTGVITANNTVWDRAEKNKQIAEANCFKEYPISF